MDILKVFKLDDNVHHINIQGTTDDPLFQANQIGQLLGIKKIRTSIKDFSDNHKVALRTDTLGGPQEVTFLTEKGLYKLLGMSRKKIAETFQDWMVEVIKEIRTTGRYELQKERELDAEIAKNLARLMTHKTLVEANPSRRLVYIALIRVMLDGKMLIKIGSTDKIAVRANGIKGDFGDCIFLDVFVCNNNRSFEKDFLHKHPFIKSKQYTDVIHKGNKSTEVFTCTPEEYEEIVKIAKKNVKHFDNFTPEQVLEMEKVKLQRKDIEFKNRVAEIIATDPAAASLLKDVLAPSPATITYESEDEPESDTIKRSPDDKPRINTRNRKVQKYDPVTFELVETFEGIMDAIRKMPKLSQMGIKEAAKANTVYNGYRWHFIDRNAPDIEYEIEETKEIHSSVPQFVAMLDIDQVKIVNVFESQALAARSRHMKTSSVNSAISKGTISSGHYFKLFDNCSDELKAEYVSRADLPKPYAMKGTLVHQVDPISRKIVKTYDSVASVLKHIHASRNSLKVKVANNEVYKGYLWKFGEYNEAATHNAIATG